MVEAMVAIGLLATILSAATSGIAVGAGVALTGNKNVTAEIAARSQMEAVKGQPYVDAPGSYTAVAPPPGYSTSSDTLAVPGGDGNIELVRVTVLRDGQAVGVVESYKVRR